jgi:hypothetical protein
MTVPSIQTFCDSLSSLVSSFCCEDPVRTSNIGAINSSVKALGTAFAASDFPQVLKNDGDFINAYNAVLCWTSDSKNQQYAQLAICEDPGQGIINTIDVMNQKIIANGFLGPDGIWALAIYATLCQVPFWIGPGKLLKNRPLQEAMYTLYSVTNLIPFLSSASQASAPIQYFLLNNPYLTNNQPSSTPYDVGPYLDNINTIIKMFVPIMKASSKNRFAA